MRPPLIHESEESLVDERGRLQRVSDSLPTQSTLSLRTQLAVDERDEGVECPPVAFAPSAQQLAYGQSPNRRLPVARR